MSLSCISRELRLKNQEVFLPLSSSTVSEKNFSQAKNEKESKPHLVVETLEMPFIPIQASANDLPNLPTSNKI